MPKSTGFHICHLVLILPTLYSDKFKRPNLPPWYRIPGMLGWSCVWHSGSVDPRDQPIQLISVFAIWYFFYQLNCGQIQKTEQGNLLPWSIPGWSCGWHSGSVDPRDHRRPRQPPRATKPPSDQPTTSTQPPPNRPPSTPTKPMGWKACDLPTFRSLNTVYQTSSVFMMCRTLLEAA